MCGCHIASQCVFVRASVAICHSLHSYHIHARKLERQASEKSFTLNAMITRASLIFTYIISFSSFFAGFCSKIHIEIQNDFSFVGDWMWIWILNTGRVYWISWTKNEVFAFATKVVWINVKLPFRLCFFYLIIISRIQKRIANAGTIYTNVSIESVNIARKFQTIKKHFKNYFSFNHFTCRADTQIVAVHYCIWPLIT